MIRRRALSLVLALVLCLQSGLAMAHCLRMAASPGHTPFQVEICTPEGLVTLDLGESGEGDGQGETRHAGFCPACHAVPHAALPAPTLTPLPILAATAPPPLPREALAPAGARAPPYRPTGPPALS
jgi:hypothetical protein